MHEHRRNDHQGKHTHTHIAIGNYLAVINIFNSSMVKQTCGTTTRHGNIWLYFSQDHRSSWLCNAKANGTEVLINFKIFILSFVYHSNQTHEGNERTVATVGQCQWVLLPKDHTSNKQHNIWVITWYLCLIVTVNWMWIISELDKW